MKEITFAWDIEADPDIVGHRLYGVSKPNTYIFGKGFELADIPVLAETSVTISIADGKWYFVLTSYDANGNESPPTNELVLLDNPQGFRIQLITNK